MECEGKVIENLANVVTILHEKVLGKGNFGEVKEGLLYEEKVAVKILFKLGKHVTQTDEAMRELNTMTELNHRNIVKLLGIIDGGIDFNNEPKLVFEYVKNGSLANFVSTDSRDQNTLIRLCYDVVCGMEYLHSKNYIHRDLAARNVLVDEMHRAKVADFGLSRLINTGNCPESYYYFVDGAKPLPIRWSSKETIQAIISLGSEDGKFSFASDVWSFGVTMWEVWTGGKLPYCKKGKPIPNNQVIGYINEGHSPNSFDVPENAPAEILEIMDRIFQADRKLRPKFVQLKETFENNYDNTFLSESSVEVRTKEVNTKRQLTLKLSLTETTWWPVKKLLVQALQCRKSGDMLLIEKLHEILSTNRRRMVVICQSEPAAKFSGLGGVGKSLTAKWYAHHYEKLYQRIIWVDAGEDSLLKSFKYLARDLDLKNRTELEDLARGCYEKLSKYKCLWIFDNVESYMTKDKVNNLLPSNYDQFDCLITTQSRDNWGNDNGYGEISKIEIDVFDESESIDFLKTYLHPHISHTEYQLRQLSVLLGNLPLALQLAVATLNNRKMDLQNYIDQISTNYDFNIIEETFDDYQRTINKNILISLQLIKQEPKGKLAYKVFQIFGYIRPDDIQFEFLRTVSGVNIQELQSSIEILLKYSLITKSGKEICMARQRMIDKLIGRNNDEVERDVLSIHRLLQQVIRHNGKMTENETIRRILNCKGYIDYKLVPYLHANDELKAQFQDIRAQLIGQVVLQTLLAAKRFEEALQLSKFIHSEVKNQASLYNYAICLDLRGEHQEALKIFNELNGKLDSSYVAENECGFQTGIIPLECHPTKLHIQYALLSHSLRERKIRTEILYTEPKADHITLSLDFGHLKEIVQSLEACSIQCYSLQNAGSKITLQIDSDVGKPVTKKMMFTGCSINKDIELPRDLRRLSLTNVTFTDENNEELNDNYLHLLTANVKQLSLYVQHCESSLPWNAFIGMNHVDLRNCKIILPANPAKISPKILRLEEIKIFHHGVKKVELHLNDIIDFKKSKKLHLNATNDSTQFSIDLKDALIAKEVKLLDKVRVTDWDEAKWNITSLTLKNVPFAQKNDLKITEFDTNSVVEISCIPHSIQKLKILKGAMLINSSGKWVELSKLKLLHFCDIVHPSNFLFLFRDCRNLVKLKLELHSTFTVQVKLRCIPQSVTQIEIISNFKIVSVDFVGRMERPLDILIIHNMGFNNISDILQMLRPNHLVIHCNENENAVNELMNSIKSHTVIPTILISTNRQDYYYKTNKRQTISKTEFDNLFCKYF